MAENEPQGSKFGISIGNVSQSQIVTGDGNNVNMTVGLTPEEAAQLRDVFADLRSTIAAQAPADRRAEAEQHVRELEQAVTGDEPDPDRVRTILRWFKEQAPQLAGAVVSVVVNPLVGKAVQGAGEAIAERFGAVVEEEG